MANVDGWCIKTARLPCKLGILAGVNPNKSVYLDLYCIRQLGPEGAAYREEGKRLFGMPTGVCHSTDDFASPSDAFNPTKAAFEMQGGSFTNKGAYSVHKSCEDAFRIEIKHGTHSQDVEQLLGAIMSQLSIAVPTDGPRTLKIGWSDVESGAMAEYNPADKSVNFYADEVGRLLVNAQIAELLAPGDEVSNTQLAEFLQIAVAHECGHALQGNYHRILEALANDFEAIRKEGQGAERQPGIEALIEASSTEYLSRAYRLWQQQDPEFTNYHFAAEIWADVIAQSRLKRFDTKAAIVPDWVSLTSVISTAASIGGGFESGSSPENGKEKLEKLQGRLHQLHHEKLSYPPRHL